MLLASHHCGFVTESNFREILPYVTVKVYLNTASICFISNMLFRLTTYSLNDPKALP